MVATNDLLNESKDRSDFFNKHNELIEISKRFYIDMKKKTFEMYGRDPVAFGAAMAQLDVCYRDRLDKLRDEFLMQSVQQ